jgi:hypothetical protein
MGGSGCGVYHRILLQMAVQQRWTARELLTQLQACTGARVAAQLRWAARESLERLLGVAATPSSMWL